MDELDMFLTDSDDEKAVEDVLSQARDHSVLEQIAAINCSSFDHNLPTHLETRFRKLKSLPTTTTTTSAKSKSFTPHSVVDFEQIPNVDSPDEKVLKSKARNKSRSDSSTSFPSESESGTLSPNTGTKSKLKSLTTSFKSMRRSISSLWCSPKKEKRKQGKEIRSLSSLSSTSLGDFNDVEFLKSFSTKEQKKILKKAMKEEEKINREADKIVKWAKQASDRIMDVSGLDLEEDELTHHFKNTK